MTKYSYFYSSGKWIHLAHSPGLSKKGISYTYLILTIVVTKDHTYLHKPTVCFCKY